MRLFNGDVVLFVGLGVEVREMRVEGRFGWLARYPLRDEASTG